LLSGAVAAQSGPAKPLDATMARVSAYVDTFVTRFANVTATEDYVQERMLDHRKRVLKSDYLLINLSGRADLLEFRDIYEVDGKPVGDRSQRVTTLLASGTEKDWLPRARAVAREAARYNLEAIGTLNRPLVALSILQRRYQERFIFTIGPIDKKVSPVARLIQFREEKLPYLYGVGVGVALRGRVWADDVTGVVLKTELLIGDSKFPNQIITTFAPDPGLQIHVPVQMTEWYNFGSFEVTGKAAYGQFRKFSVASQETYQ